MSADFDVVGAAAYLGSRLGAVPRVSIVLGSGLGTVVEAATESAVVPFEEIPTYPSTGVPGHAGRYVLGRVGEVDVLFQCGRFHYYEGHGDGVVAGPVRVAAALGVHTLVFTNAAGAIREDLEPGSIVLVEDHINWMFRSPLEGPVRKGEERFPDMAQAYDERLRAIAQEVASERGSRLPGGVYAGVRGPAYETPAEVRALAKLGADLVGMSTVPEVTAARALGIRCAAFSVVTNKAAGLAGADLSHDEVVRTGHVAAERLSHIIAGLVAKLAGDTYEGSAK